MRRVTLPEATEPNVETVNIRFADDVMTKLREAARKRGVTIYAFVRRAGMTEDQIRAAREPLPEGS